MASESRLRFLRPFTNQVINRVIRPVAGRLPGFAILTYVGRTSGRRYSIPINVFERDGWYVFALTYGSDVQWLKNVLAAGGCEMRTRGHDIQLIDPEVFEDPGRRLMPMPARLILRINGVTTFVRMRLPGATWGPISR